MKAKVPTALKVSVALVFWSMRVPSRSMHSVPSASLMAQLVPSLRCHQWCVPTSISQGHLYTQISTSLYPELTHSVPHAPWGVFHHPNQQFSKCGPVPKAKLIFITLSHYLPFLLSLWHAMTQHHHFDGNGLCPCVSCFKNVPVSISKMLTNYRYNPQKQKQKLLRSSIIFRA